MSCRCQGQSDEGGVAQRPALRVVQPRPEERYVTCVPLVPLEAAAGGFGDPHGFLGSSDWEWVAIDVPQRLRPGMFVAKVVGKSMEPRIPDGSYCLFSSPVSGTRQGRIVLVQLQDATDPDTGLRFTVKRYMSETATSEDGTWRHVKVTLEPLNRDYQCIELTCEDEGLVNVVAELVTVVGLAEHGVDSPDLLREPYGG